MGIYDRDYYRAPTRSARLPNWSITIWLIVINAAVYGLDQLLQGWLLAWCALSIDTGVYGLQIWRFFTLQFIHFSFQHIFFNMLALYFFGPIVEQMLGTRRYLAFYLICGVCSGLFFVALWLLNILTIPPEIPMAGASGSIFGVLIAASVIAPNAIVRIDFLFPVRLRTMAIFMVALAAFTVFRYGNSGAHNAGGEAAHLGGAAMGYLLIKYPRLLDFANFRRGPRMRYRP